MKMIIIASAVLCCLFAVCSAQGGYIDEATGQSFIVVPNLYCLPFIHYNRGYHFVYICDAPSITSTPSEYCNTLRLHNNNVLLFKIKVPLASYRMLLKSVLWKVQQFSMALLLLSTLSVFVDNTILFATTTL